MNVSSFIRRLATTASLVLVASSASALEGRIFFEPRCPVGLEAAQEKELAGVVVDLVGKVVGALTGAAIDAIAAKLSTEKQVTVVATERRANWYVQSVAAGAQKYDMDSNLVCVVFAVGENFKPKGAKADSWPDAPPLETAKEDYRQLRRAANELASLGITSPPVFYIEYRVTTTDAGPVFALDPRFVYYPEFLGSSVVFGPNKRDLLVQIEFYEPGSDTAFAQTSFQRNALEPGKLSTSQIKGLRSPWSKQPSTGSGNSGERLVPFNMKAMFTETAKPGKLGTVLAGVLTDQKAALVGAADAKAKFAISESERQSVRNAAADAANTALTNYLSAVDGYDTAKKALDTAKAGTDQAAVAKAQNQVDLAKIRLDNALAIARAAFQAADIPFTPVPSS